MAETTSPRFGFNRWSADADTVSRAEVDGNFGQTEAKGMVFAEGTRAARPASGVKGRIYTVIGDPSAALNGLQYYDDGTQWWALDFARHVIGSEAAASPALQVDGFAGQTADIFQVRTNTGTVLFRVDPDGDLWSKSITPTDPLPQSKTHASADTDAGPESIHHTLGTSANEAAAGNHGHPANVTRVLKSGGSWPGRPADAEFVEWVGASPGPTVGVVDGDTFVATS
jgi:hypothetical protein